MKLSDYAKENKISYMTAWRWWKAGHIVGTQMPTGTILIDDKGGKHQEITTVIYTRVSSPENKKNLDGQVERITQFCIASGYSVDVIVREVGSGVNENRKKLVKLLNSGVPIRLVVEHKDRLTRFGFNYIKIIIEQNGGEIVVVNKAKEDVEDLIQDLVAIVYSFSAKLYSKRRAKQIKQVVKDAIS